MNNSYKINGLVLSKIVQTDRQTNIIFAEREVITDLFVIVMKEIYYVHEYKYKIVHGMTNITKIILSGIVMIKIGYFDNINGYYLELPLGMRIFNFVNFESLIYINLYNLLILNKI